MSGRAWRIYPDDIIKFAENVLSYSAGLDQPTFVSTGLNYDATVCNLELIGEAATHIPIEIPELYSSVPWRQLIATRNRLIHGYLGIDNDTLRSIIQDDKPQLLNELQFVVNNCRSPTKLTTILKFYWQV